MKYAICPWCVGVSTLWFSLSVGVAWFYLDPAVYLLPIALLMGGSVVGVANKLASPRHKISAVLVGFPTAYFLVTQLNPTTVVIEAIILLILAVWLFRQKELTAGPNSDSLGRLVNQLDNCCDE